MMSDVDSIDEAEFLSACGDAPRSQFEEFGTWDDEESDHGFTATQSLVTALEENPWDSDYEGEGRGGVGTTGRELDSAPATRTDAYDTSAASAGSMLGTFPDDESHTTDAVEHPASAESFKIQRMSAHQEELLSGMGLEGERVVDTIYPDRIAEGADVLVLEENRWETATATSEVVSEPPERDLITHNLGARPRSATDGHAEAARHPRLDEETESRAHRASRSPRGPRPSKRHRGNREYSPLNLTCPVPEAARRNGHRSGRQATAIKMQMKTSDEGRLSSPPTQERSRRHGHISGRIVASNASRDPSTERRDRSRHSQPGSTVRSDSGPGSSRFGIFEESRASRSNGMKRPKYSGFCWGWRPFRRGH